MANPRPVDSPSVRSHKRQFAWQILTPFLLMAGLIIAGAALVISGEATRTRAWADVSLIWILAPMLVLALVFTIVLGSLIYGFTRLMPLIPRFTGRAQQITSAVAAGTRKVADGTTKPFVWVQQAGAVIKSFINKM